MYEHVVAAFLLPLFPCPFHEFMRKAGISEKLLPSLSIGYAECLVAQTTLRGCSGLRGAIGFHCVLLCALASWSLHFFFFLVGVPVLNLDL